MARAASRVFSRRHPRAWLACALAAFVCLVSALPAPAVQPDEVLPDAQLEARARVLSRELRCMVCQNQSIDDSDAPLARDIRLLVRERLKAGDSDSQIIDFLVARYGEFVLLRPRFEWTTALLWLTPFAVFVLGLAVTVLAWRKRRAQAEADLRPLSESERRALDELVAEADSRR